MCGLSTSVIGRAIRQNIIRVETVNIRDYTEEKHGRVDDYTYGGGAGMLMQAQPVYDAFADVRARIPKSRKKRVIYVTPQGRPFTQQTAEELAENDDLVLLCGHYEGVDERVLEEIVTDYISIGDYVLTGGELAAMVIVDAVARLVPSVLHNEGSAQTESFRGELLEYPQYSRPKEWHGRCVPPVLLSGNQREIERWRRQEAEARTAERRPDLYARYLAQQECEKILLSDKLHHMDMIELIRSGRARLVARQENEILLEDRGTHVVYHTKAAGKRPHEVCKEGIKPEIDENAGNNAIIDKIVGKYAKIVLHQPEYAEELARYGYQLKRECLQCVCTRREQLPIAGLYGVDGRNPRTGLAIREMSGEPYALAYGAFIEGMRVGYIGARADGCVDLLEVLPQYRRRGIATALETYLFNRLLRSGRTPYGQAETGNHAFLALQEKLGIPVAKKKVYWMEI